MGLNSRGPIDPRFFEYVREPSRGFETAVIDIVDPDRQNETPYDPVTNTGGESTPFVVWPQLRIGEPNAWLEVINASKSSNGSPQPHDDVDLRVHIDLDRFGTTNGIRPGFLIRAGYPDRDTVLQDRIIVIRKVTTGSLAVQRTLECSINEKAYI